MSTELERIAKLEVHNDGQEEVIKELRADLKEIRTLVHAINSKLASITHDHAVTSGKTEETYALANKLSGIVDKMIEAEKERNITIKVGGWVLSALITVGTFSLTVYQYRYTVGEFFKKVFG